MKRPAIRRRLTLPPHSESPRRTPPELQGACLPSMRSGRSPPRGGMEPRSDERLSRLDAAADSLTDVPLRAERDECRFRVFFIQLLDGGLDRTQFVGVHARAPGT